MIIVSRSVLAAACALASSMCVSAHADELDMPASAALMMGDPINSACQVIDVPRGIVAVDHIAGICDFAFPLTIPPGHTIEQITIVHGTLANHGLAVVNAYLSTLNFATSVPGTEFEWLSSAVVPDGTFQGTHLMNQTKFGYPDEFVTQPNTMYQIVAHVEDGAFVTGLQVIYQ